MVEGDRTFIVRDSRTMQELLTDKTLTPTLNPTSLAPAESLPLLGDRSRFISVEVGERGMAAWLYDIDQLEKGFEPLNVGSVDHSVGEFVAAATVGGVITLVFDDGVVASAHRRPPGEAPGPVTPPTTTAVGGAAPVHVSPGHGMPAGDSVFVLGQGDGRVVTATNPSLVISPDCTVEAGHWSTPRRGLDLRVAGAWSRTDGSIAYAITEAGDDDTITHAVDLIDPANESRFIAPFGPGGEAWSIDRHPDRSTTLHLTSDGVTVWASLLDSSGNLAAGPIALGGPALPLGGWHRSYTAILPDVQRDRYVVLQDTWPSSTLFVLDGRTLDKLGEFTVDADGEPVLDPVSGELIVFAGGTGKVTGLSPVDGSARELLYLPNREVVAAAYDGANERFIVVAWNDGVVEFHHVEMDGTHSLLSSAPLPHQDDWDLTMGSNGDGLLIGEAFDERITLWRVGDEPVSECGFAAPTDAADATSMDRYPETPAVYDRLPLPGDEHDPSASSGYWLLSAAGDVLEFGRAARFDSFRGGFWLDMTTRPGDGGAWAVNYNSGEIRPLGGAPQLGSASFRRAVGIASTPDGNGYWVVSDQGVVEAFGSADHLGDLGALTLAEAAQAIVSTESGNGYWILGGDGGVFTFGDAEFRGSIPQVLPGVMLDAEIVGLVAAPDGGYWLVGADGGVFSFDAPFVGSLPATLGDTPLDGEIVGMIASGTGYLLIGGDGGVFNFGDQPFVGSMGGTGMQLVTDIEVWRPA